MLVQGIVSKLSSSPLVVPVNGHNLSFGYRFCVGKSLAVNGVLQPVDSNVLILTDVKEFSRIPNPHKASLTEIESALVSSVIAKLQSAITFIPLPVSVDLDAIFCAKQGAYDALVDKNDDAAKELKSSIPNPTSYLTFSSASDARAAYEFLVGEHAGIELPSQVPHVTHQSETAFRVTFAISNVATCALEEVPAKVANQLKLLPPIDFGRGKLWPVDMACRNHSKWHMDLACDAPPTRSLWCTHHLQRVTYGSIKALKLMPGSLHQTGNIAAGH